MTCRHKTAARALERAAIYSAEQTPQPATFSKVLSVVAKDRQRYFHCHYEYHAATLLGAESWGSSAS
jgi:hypothetical protein